jgi:hypothetical protein
MNENTKNSKGSKKSKRYILLSIVVFILIFLILKTFFYKSAQEQLAEIEASLAIPESENAAAYYNMFFTDSNNIAILDELFSSYSQASYYLPWTSNSDPKGSAALGKNKGFIEIFIEISKINEARFPIITDNFNKNNILSCIRVITFILSWAGANDLGDGRIDEAMDKFISQVMIGNHLNQQPVRIYKEVGVAIESVGLRNIRDLTMNKDITIEQLRLLDRVVAETQNYVGHDKELEERINNLLSGIKPPNVTFLTSIKQWFIDLLARKEAEKRWQDSLLREISTQRASRILIALRLFQKQNSRWPKTLSEIKSSLPKENFTDAMNNSGFVYKLTDDGFILYSKGLDNIDNNHKKGFDDVIFWSPPISLTTPKQYTDPNKESKE